MNDLKLTNSNIEIEKITSIEISEITGKQHSNIMRDIRNLVSQIKEINGFTFELVDYVDLKGETRPMYLLTKKDCLLLSSGYDALLRAKIINRWEDLEIKNMPKFDIPTTLSGALMLAAKQAEQIEKQEALLLEQAPKVNFYEAVTGSTDTIDMRSVATTLNCGLGRNKIFEILREKKVLDSKNKPYQSYVDRGYFRTIESSYCKPDGSECINIKTVVFQKGLDFIRKTLNK